MRNTKELLEDKIDELKRIKKKCSEDKYLSEAHGMLANYALRDFIEWNLKDLDRILKSLK
jgi:hypothetical protein